jgi:diketogulonate reductase-like aldo/keto reductase
MVSNEFIFYEMNLFVGNSLNVVAGSDLIAVGLQQGYRLIDTAEFYNNEHSVGAGIKKSGKKREEVFVISKWWPTSEGANGAIKSLDNCLKKFVVATFLCICLISFASLESNYVDLYMIHAPKEGCCGDAYRTLIDAKKEGKIK